MTRPLRRAFIALLFTASCFSPAWAQKPLSWPELQQRFRDNNPTLLAGRIAVDQNRAQEITAGLRPNPVFSLLADNTQFYTADHGYRPFANQQYTPSLSYLVERQHKRQLRVESARTATTIAIADQADLERTLLFTLRSSYVQVLQAEAVLDLARENLTYYDRVVAVNRERYKAGDISQADLNRVELQRVQFQTDVVNGQVGVRTAKIALLGTLNDRTALDQFEVSGPFAFQEKVLLLPELRQMALDSRPDLQSAGSAINKARTDNRLAYANGSTDPTWGFDYVRSAQTTYSGLNVTVPIRIFDRNQGEKARTALEIKRTERLREGVETAILRDVDSAYETVQSTVSLLKPYRDTYLRQAAEVRESVSFAYSNGASTLLDFLDAQKSYRDIQLQYLNLIGSYLNAAAQLNLAVGREVIE